MKDVSPRIGALAITLAIASAGCATAPIEAGFAHAVRFTQAALAERSPTAASSGVPHLGQEACLHAEIVPTAASSAALDLALDVTATCDRDASTVSVGLEIVRDDGVLFAEPSFGTASARDAASWATATPALDDGFYAIQLSALRLVTTRAGAPDDYTVANDSMYVHVDRGTVTVLSIEEYFGMSRANEGRLL